MVSHFTKKQLMISGLADVGFSAHDFVIDLLVDAVEFFFDYFEIFLVLHKMLLKLVLATTSISICERPFTCNKYFCG